jgi:hypothetical protein
MSEKGKLGDMEEGGGGVVTMYWPDFIRKIFWGFLNYEISFVGFAYYQRHGYCVYIF